MRALLSLSSTFLLLCGIATAQSNAKISPSITLPSPLESPVIESTSATPTPVVRPIRQLHEKPCLGDISRPWKNYVVTSLGWNPESLIPEVITAHEDSILVVDSWQLKSCARFLVFIDGRRVAKTERSSSSSHKDCEDSDNCTKKSDYLEAYITLPKGKYSVDIRVPKNSVAQPVQEGNNLSGGETD
ncbi:hypothetical protein COCSADRAFT_193649 [Bipolaris sorokiniana ND90Pr]|uniref:Uncharacterized protein n=1 Tax=Cochliobolus sativus (strain ND90Pr / ATCC 201652) TaxID=665912 RepID=M2RZ00_COCSN|nr:uncharacterized protein COCSADRAFT_193649 [Bipolaris sorokiniana ND90Pr]EMD60253.1 hypothetical protein COCSADRAFT_193649 [Bipolaris sorokiniana ND90Pr]